MISKATFSLTKFRARTNALLKDAIIATLVFSICCTMTGGAFTTSAATVREKKGEKNFKQGMQYEQMQKWEQAAQEFALAVAADPANIEYQLHYRRSIFNASQTFMLQGRALAERGDYVGAYNAFRQSYGYDQANELALSEMDRMLRLQREATGGNTTSPNGAGTPPASTTETTTKPPAGQTATIAPTDYRTDASPNSARPTQDPANPSPRTEQRRIINYSNVDLESVIRNLAEQVELNVLFDRDFPKRTLTINLRDVTTAQALDYIFLAQGLFFQKLSRRTILVADQSKRPQFQQMQIRTFYLSNIAPEDARTVITQVVPPQPGRNSLIAVNKTTNSLTVRDTPEYIRLIGEVIKSIDKDRAEVVMDVSIYEVSRSDLLQFGNQIGNETSLTALGGSGAGSIALTAADIVLRGGGAALVFPTSQLIALQRKDHTRLVASTQVHAFDGEASEARIGQRVPVQTAQTFPYTGGTTQTGTTGNVNPGIGFAGGIPVFTYEPTGLTLNFTPQVFPNLDVQVKMSIESKEVFNPGATPTFTERTIKGTARIQNNRTMMLASVAQNRESNGRQGLPLLGLIPILGRLFTAPRRDNAQTDIVIAVTPRVLRAPAITPRDEEPFGSGSQQTPISEPLETMLIQAEREEQLASARQLPRNVQIELPPAAPVVNQAANNQTTNNQAASSPATNAQSTTASNATTTNTAATQTKTNAVNTSAANPVASNSSASNTLVSNAQTTAPPSYIPAPDILLGGANQPTVPKSPDANSVVALPRGNTTPTTQTLSMRLNEPVAMTTALTSNALPAPPTLPAITNAPSDAAPSNQTAHNYTSAAELRLVPEQQQMRVGERRRLMMVLKTDAPLGVVVSTLRFDPRLIAIRRITSGTMLASGGGGAATNLTQSIDPKGFALVSVAPPNGSTAMSGVGVLFIIEIEALAPGTGAVSFLTEDVHLVATDGREIKTRAAQSKIVINQ